MSEPAFGSVMAKQLIVSVETILGRYFFFCSSDAVAQDGKGRAEGLHVQGYPQRGAGPGDLLGDDGAGQKPHAVSPVFLGDEGSVKTQVGHLFHDFPREVALLLPLFHKGNNLFVGEIPGSLPQGLQFFAQLEIHLILLVSEKLLGVFPVES